MKRSLMTRLAFAFLRMSNILLRGGRLAIPGAALLILAATSTAFGQADPYAAHRIPSSWAGHTFTPSPADWRRVAVYQVMTDRFANGDPNNDHAQNFSTAYDANSGDYPQDQSRRTIGGDFKGLTANLDYIKSLGFDAIWISAPLMGAEPNGYAPTTYGILDPKLGTADEFRTLINEAHARGMYVIIDCVANHFANWFNDNGSYNGGGYGAPTYKYGSDRNYGPNFGDPIGPNDFHNNGWINDWNNGDQLERGELVGLDDLKTENEWVRNYVIEKWSNFIKAFDVDGFRVDAIKHINIQDMATMAQAWRGAAASVGKTNFYMFGEAFSGSHGAVGYYTGNKAGTGKRVMNGMMDYAMYMDGVPWKLFNDQWGLKNWIAGMNNGSYDMGQGDGTTTWNFANMNLHFADNHDNPRFLSTVGDWDQMAAEIGLLTTIEGVGGVYYGSEQAFNTGGKDGRGAYSAMFDHPYQFDNAAGDNLNMTHYLYKNVARILRARRYIGAGLGFGTDLRDPQNGIFSFKRGADALVAINGTSGQTSASLWFGDNGSYTDLVNGATVTGPTASVTLPKFGVGIFVKNANVNNLEPLVQSIAPGHAARENVSQVVVTFDRVMDAATTIAAASITPDPGGAWSVFADKLTYSGGTFNKDWMYTVRVERTAKSMNGKAMNGGFISRFWHTGGVTPPPPPPPGTVVSPEVNGNKVTFRFSGGTNVSLKGSWKVTSGLGADYTATYDATWNAGAKTAMVNTGGIWAVTLTLDPNKMFEYGFDVNGAWTNDPANSNHAANGNDKVTTGEAGPIVPINNDQPQLKVNGAEGNYGTIRVFLDEGRMDRKDITIEFAANSDRVVTAVECFTNLDRRDFATLNEDASTIVAGSAAQTYFKAYTMYPGGIGYTYTLPVSKTGVYRVTVRYKVDGDPNWRWFSNGSTRRDAVVVASPTKARELNMYELQVNAIEATDDNWAARSTFADLTSADNDGYNPISVDSLRSQGINTVWLQPIHPIGSKDEPAPFNQQGDPGSPYAVKNFFAVNQVLGADNTREGAMQEFKSFVAEADQKGLNIFFDVTFNHSAWDVEVGPAGLAMGAAPTSQIRDIRPQWYTRRDPTRNYLDSTAYLWWERARNKNEIAVAPADRHDFGKWADVTDFYFGAYSALGSPKNEADGLWNKDTTVDELVEYFANYSQFWLEQTGNTGNQSQSQMGIDGFRCDFAQGVPPQAWEYIINKTRSRKWDFIFMAESLDGGEVSRRAARQFDIVNDNWVWSTEMEFNPGPWREAIERHKSAYDPGMLILRNVVTHDHHAPEDPWMAAMRTGVHATVDGVPLVYAGMERGLKLNYGYAHFLPQYGRYHMNFKTWNDMTLLWDSSPVGMPEYYANIMRAREQSAALKSGNQWFLFQKNGQAHGGIFAAAKWEGADVVLAFVNMHYWSAQNGIFDLGGSLGPGAQRLALRPGRSYNVVNLASSDPGKRLWTQARTAEDILANGIYVGFNGQKHLDGQVAQYLKLIDVSDGIDPSFVGWTPQNPTASEAIVITIGRAGTLLWGVNASGSNWERPDASYRPAGSTEFGATAIESPFTGPDVNGRYTLRIGPFNGAQSVRSVDFVIHYADNTWNNNGGADFHFAVIPVADSTPPAAPTGLVGTSGINAVNLRWNPVANADLNHYSVFVKTASGANFVEAGSYAPIGKDTGFLAYNIYPDVNPYLWYVVAVDNAGNISAPSATIEVSPQTQTVDTQAPSAPLGVTATPGPGTITLRWTANAEADLAGYDVYDRTYSNGIPTKVNATRISGTEFVVNNLAPMVQFSYSIVAVDNPGNISAHSSTVSAIPTQTVDTNPPAAPTGVVAAGGTNQIVVSWNASGEFDVEGYYVNTRPTGTSTWTSLGYVAATTYTHTGLATGAMHEYYIAAKDASGNTSQGSAVATGRVLGGNTGKPPIYISFLWHMHQPIYYPGESLTQTDGAGRYGFSPVGVHFDRTGPYTTWPMDAVQNAANAGLEHAAAQVSFSGSLAENLDNLEQNGRGFFGWKNRWHESNWWKTSLGNPRVDLVAFGYHHPLMTLVDNDIVRQQIRDHRDKYLQTWNKAGVPQRNYSRGMFPAENAFAERNIPALVDEGIEWVMVDNIHFQRAAQGYPWNSGGNLYPPNKADQQNANPNDWVQLNGVWAPTKVSARWSMQPHYVQSVDPVSGEIKRIIAVPTERYMGNEDGRGGFGALQYEAVMSQIESQNTDPNHPAIIVLHHDGDNYGGGTEAYYHSNFDGFINWVKSNPSRFQFIGVQDYLQLFPPDPSDIIHVEAGSWAGADNGDPEFMKWNGDPNATTGYSPDYNSWGVMMASANRVLTANAIAPNDNNVKTAMRHLLNGFASDYWYWDGTEIWDGLPAVASNLAVNLADPVIPNGADVVAPTLYAPQRNPYNPGELEWGTTAKPRDFEVWTWGYDVSGIQSINVKYRIDNDGVNPITSTQNEVYGNGAEVGVWISLPMGVKNFPPQVASPQPRYRAEMYSAMITGLSGKLVDYYIEAVDNRGNLRRSPIEHVWVGTGGGGTTSNPVGVSWNPGAPSGDQAITISNGKAGKLHWGINNWVVPPAEYRPAGSVVMSTQAIQTPMTDADGDGVYTVTIGPFLGATAVTKIDFVMAHADGSWNNNGGSDFHITVGPPMNSNTDTIRPVITLGALPLTTANSSATVSGSVDDPAATVKVNGTTVALSNSTFTQIVPLAMGVNSVTVTATDAKGNVSTVTRPVLREDPTGEVQVLTLNLHTYQETDQQAKFDTVARAIVDLRPDVVAFQEVGQLWAGDGSDNAAKIIRDRVVAMGGPYYEMYWEFSHRGFSIYKEGVAVLSRHGFRSTEGQYVSTEQSPDVISSRKVVRGEVSIPGVGDVQIYSAHTSWWDQGLQEQVANLKAWVAQKATASVKLSIVAGDFNANAGSDGYNLIVNNGEYVDEYVIANPGGFNDATMSDGTRIDYIFTAAANKFAATSASKIFTAASYGRVSDHMGVYARLRPIPPSETQPPVVDTTAPVITLNAVPDSTVASSITVSGSVNEPASTVKVNGTIVSLSAGSFSSQVALTLGANTITFTATDTSNNTSSVTRTVTRVAPPVVDTTAPVVSLDPAAGTTTSASITIAGVVNDATAVVKVNSAAVTLDGNLRFSTVVNLALGSNAIAVTATDAAGNVGTSSLSMIREAVADLPPAQPSGLVAAGGVNQVTLGWNANAENDIAGYFVNVRTVGAANWASLGLVTATSYTHSGLTAGTTYDYYIAAKDNAGQTSTGSATASAAPISGGGGQVPIYIAYHWHMHQPVYWPGENIVTTYSTRSNYSFVRDVVGWPDRVDAYTHNPIDNVDRFRYLPNYGAQISYSGSLVENLDNMAAVGHSYGNGWSNRYAEGHSWKTALNNSRVDLVAFGYHHPLMPLIDERDMRLQIQMHRRKITGRFGQPYSKGIFPPESAFSERMIPGLVAEGIEWAMVDNLHIDHANKNFPWTIGEKINPPNRADAVNPPASNYVNLSCQTNTNYNISPATLRPHFTKYVDPATGTEMRMIVVPLERSLGYDDSYGDRTPQQRLEQLLQYNTDPAHPILIVLAHDGDNAGASGFRYYVETMGWIGGADPNKFRLTTVQDYLTQFPPSPADVVHVTDGSWVGADLGDQELHKWLGDPVKSGQVNFDEGYSADWNSWMAITAGKNRMLTAEAIQAPSSDVQAIIDASGNAVDKGWHDFLGGEVSCYWYWDGTVQWDEQPTRSTNNAMNHVDPIISGAAGTDPVPPTLFSLQREPYNPGGEEAFKGTQPSDFRVFTFGYDVNGITNITLKYRVDEDGENPLSTNANEVYAQGAGVGAWVEVPMSVKPFANPPANQLQPRYRASAYEAWVRGLSNVLVDYYVEATDGRGNVQKTAIHHVYVGNTNSGPGPNPTGVAWTPTLPRADQTIVVSSPKAGKLHWGVNGWNAPDASYRPAGTTVFSTQAVQTPLAGPDANGRYSVTIGPFMGAQAVTSIKFVIAHSDGSWNNNNGSDFTITVSPAGSGPSDTTAPVITLGSVADSTYASSIAVSGTVNEANATVKVNGATVALSAGAFSTTVNLAVGSNTITVTATDTANNTSTVSRSVTRNAVAPPPDTTAPVITLNALPATTTASSITVSGSIDDMSAALKVNGTAIPVTSIGTYSTSVALTLGANTITVTATDAAGNVATPKSATITREQVVVVDTRPSWTPSAPSANDIITITVRKAGKFHWGVNGWKKPDAAYWPAGSVSWDTYSIETPFAGPDASGAYTLQIGPFNGAVAVSEVNFVLHYNDNTWDNNNQTDYKITVAPAPVGNRAPTVSILSPANGASLTGQVSVTATASDDRSISGVRFTVDGAEVGPVATTTIGGGAGSGQVRGGRKTITVDGVNTGNEWTDAMRVASDPAWDHANVVNGAWSTHETPFDYTDLYAAWDNEFLYIGFQIVDVTDIKDPANAGSSAGTPARAMNLPQFIALDVVPGGYTGVTATGTNAGQYDAWHKGHLWNNGGGVDYQIYFASNFWQGPFLVPYGGAWNADANTIRPSATGLSGKSGAGNARGQIFDAAGTEYVAQGHNKARDSFFEIRIPLANIGNPNLDAQSVGIFVAHGDGDMKAGVDCIPNDPATSNTPGVEVWNSPKEWADIDIYTSPFVKAGTDGGGPGVPGYMVSFNTATRLDGAHTIAFTATDSDDSSSTASIGVTFANGVTSNDTTAPIVTLNAIAATTMETSVTVIGSVDDRSAIVKVNNVATTVDASGNFAKNVLLAIGVNTITVTATDTVGNASTRTASIERQRVPDTTAPLLNVTPLPATTMEASILVSGTVDEIDAIIAIGSETTMPNGSGAFSRTVALAVGTNAIVVTATDPSGNVATKVVSTERQVDNTAPVITLGALPDSTTEASITVSGSVDDTRATVKVNNVSVAVSGVGAFSSSVALNEGANTITVVATDIAGNVRTATKSITRIITWDPNDPYGPYRIPGSWSGHSFTPSPTDWRHLAVYQIMTDRFYDADATNNTRHTFSTDFNANGSIKPYEGNRRTIGGDFKGMTEHLDYIKSLGFDVVWISAPLMGTEANGYAPTTYGVLDSKLGTVAEFRRFVDEAHVRGMYVVVDCVSNHFANWFTDYDAFNGNGYGTPQYATSEPKRYGSNFGDPLGPNDFHNYGKIGNWTDGFQLEKGELVGLDDLKTEDAWVRSYVIEKWANMIKALDVDGFRVDAIKHVNVADMGTFAAAWRAAAASVGKNNFFMFGEAFSGDHGAVGYYTGNKAGTGNRVMNGMMDYAMYQQGIPWKLFTDQWALKNWITGMNNSSYDMGQGNGTTTWTPGNLNVHFAENHDLARFLSSVGDRDQMAAMAAMLTTIEGLGAMYYGGEQGFNTGGTDGRGAYAAMFDHDYEWDAAMGDNFNMTHPLYKSIAKIMRARRRIGSGLGTTTTLNDPQNGIFSFSRGSNAVVAINGTANSATATLPFPAGSPGTFVDLVSGATVSGASASVTLPKYSVAIFIRNGATSVLEPMVESITPAHGATSGETTITIVFDRDMDAGTTVAAASVTPNAGGTWSVGGNKLILSGATFAVGTEYTVRVDRSARGLNNFAMAGGFISRFKGGAAGSGGTIVSPQVSGTAVTFRYSGGASAGVKGSWKVTGGSNGSYTAIYDATWNGGATTPMVNSGGVWTVTINLQAGMTYEYGFMINNAWTNDPLNTTHAGNGNDQVALASGAALPNVDQTTLDLNAGVLYVAVPTGTATGSNIATGLAAAPSATFVALPITTAQVFSAATAEQTLPTGSSAETFVAVLTNVNRTKFDVSIPVYSAATGAYSDRFTLSLEFAEPVSSFVARRVQDMLLGGAAVEGEFGGNVFGFEAFDAAGRDMGASETRVVSAKLTYHSDAGIVNGKPLRDLVLNYFNPATKAWEPLATSFDALGNAVSASLEHLSIYGVAPGIGGVQTSLNNVIIYPNPFMPTDGNAENGREYVSGDLTTGIVFDRLTDNVTITVYTLRGAKVSEQVVTTGRAHWDVKTASGDPIATGVYLVVIKDNRGRGAHTEKIAVVR
jgi:glycosidase/endonuclease/exonuclease/phosphatase family metal-dependent hydrolase